jgi:hypothetical protein
VGREILPPDIRLDLDDPPGAPAGGVLANQERPEERSAGFEGRLGEDRSVENGRLVQRNG